MPTPEELARENIDRLLDRCGWVVQDKSAANLSAGRGVALRELSFKTGEPDYTLFVDGKAIGTVEAKPEGHSLTGVEEQSEKYVKGVPFGIPAWRSPLPFSCETRITRKFLAKQQRIVAEVDRCLSVVEELEAAREH
jgi:type I restriction enzyme R subunit